MRLTNARRVFIGDVLWPEGDGEPDAGCVSISFPDEGEIQIFLTPTAARDVARRMLKMADAAEELGGI